MGLKDHPDKQGYYNRPGVKPCTGKDPCEEYTFKSGKIGHMKVPCHVDSVCILAIGAGGGGAGCGQKPIKDDCACESYEHEGYPGSGGGGGSGEKVWKKICVEPHDVLYFEVGHGGEAGGACYDERKAHEDKRHGKDTNGGLDGAPGTNSLVYLNTPPRQCKNPCIVVNARGGCGGKAGLINDDGEPVGGAGGKGAIGGGGGAPNGPGGVSHDGKHPNGADAGDQAGGDGGAANGIWGCGSPCGAGGGGGKFGGSGLPRFIKEHINKCSSDSSEDCDDEWDYSAAEWEEKNRCCKEKKDNCCDDYKDDCCGDHNDDCCGDSDWDIHFDEDWDDHKDDDKKKCDDCKCKRVDFLKKDEKPPCDKKIKSATNPKPCTGSGGGGGSGLCKECWGAAGADGMIKIRFCYKKKKEKKVDCCH